MKESEKALARAVLNGWKKSHSPFPKVDFFGRWTAPASDYFVSCRHCGEAGNTRVFHADDCPVKIARKILGK